MNVSTEQLGWFVFGGIQTSINSMGASFDRVEFWVKKNTESTIKISATVGDIEKQAWYFSTFDKDSKVMKDILSIVDEVENSYDEWVEEEERNAELVERYEMAQDHYSADLAGVGRY